MAAQHLNERNTNIFSIISECIPPLTPGNGSVKVLSNDKIAAYSCEIGFTLNGSAERKCADDGTGWSDTDPTCGKLLPELSTKPLQSAYSL